MTGKNIYMTDDDMKSLRRLVNAINHDGKNLQALENELNRAKVVKPGEIPSDVVTMNSEVRLKDLQADEETTYRIVWPDQADADKGYISILAPIGTALLGYRVGDIVEWQVPAGTAKWKIEKITYQPEAAGDVQT
ncbi:MAG: nucleoside diphosphate kinase regulator [Chitinispirillaceae bacterium]|nr:nucleoside diphosphate kinase regulator [Chitinispirillaceae bacterium]